MKLIYPVAHTLDASSVTDPTNQGYMFDAYLDTQTENPLLIEVEISAGNFDRLMLFNLQAETVDIELTDNGTSTVVQTETYDLANGDGTYKPSLIEQIYIYADATLKISITHPATAKCGLCALGWSTDIGATQWGAAPGFVDYSIKSTNEFGDTYLSQGAWAKEVSATLALDKDLADAIFEDLVAARGIVTGVEFNEYDTDFECLRLYGFFKKWKMKFDNPVKVFLDIDYQGVI